MRFLRITNYFSKLLAWLAPALPLPPAWRARAFQLAPKWQLVIALLLNILSLALPVMMLQIYDRIVPHQAYGTLAMLITGVLVALALDAALRMIRAWLIGWTAASNEHAASCAVMERLAAAHLPAFETVGTGTHMQHLAALPRLRDFYSGQALTALIDLPFVALYLALAAYLGGWLVLLPLSLLGLFFLFAIYAGDRLKLALEARSQSDDRKAGHVISALSGIHTAKSLAMEAPLLRRFEQHQAKVTESSYKVALASGFAATLSAGFGQLSLIVTATAGSLFVIHGTLSVGALSACTMLSGRALQPVQRVLGTWMRLQDFAVARGQAETLLAMPIQPRSQEKLPPPKGHIVLQGASFGYGEELLLHDISLNIEPGEVIAISGDKGSGKSTLLQLMAGALTPAAGHVWLDGVEPSHYGLGQLSRHVGYMPQQSAIFKGSILENMTGFETDEDHIAIAKESGKRLGLDAVVDVLAKGYDTQLSDSNADPVPPGIKQRIALARAMRNKPAILLFDDADRALDKEGYNLLFKRMGQLKGRCTLVLVSHDQNLLSFADRFYHLEQGTLEPYAGQATTLAFMPMAERAR